MPDIYIKRLPIGVTGYADGIGEPVHVDSLLTITSTDRNLLCDRFEQSTGGNLDAAPIEYFVCSHINDHDCHEVSASFDDFDQALACLFTCEPGHYMVAARP